MVMKAEPIRDCVTALLGTARAAERHDEGVRVCLLSAQGRVFDQRTAERLASLSRLVLICGRYEGVDERIAIHCADEELSVGDFVLSGGEPAAALIVDATARLLPGVLGEPQSTINESFASTPGGGPGETGLLDCPHFTRPVDFDGWTVPEVLRQGDHAAIRRWRRREALRKTRRYRPELLARAALSELDRQYLREIEADEPTPSTAGFLLK